MSESAISLSLPLMTFLIVVKNEASHILGAVESVLSQKYDGMKELVIVDGMSTDGTREVVQSIVSAPNSDFLVKALDNSRGSLASGWNIGVRNAGGELILRLDGHSRLHDKYAETCASRLIELREADPTIVAVGGKRITVDPGEGLWQRSIAAAQRSSFGVGNSRYRFSDEAGFVDTIAMAVYHRIAFDIAGEFDERLGRSEDNEFHSRLSRSGCKLYLSPETTSYYFPRSTLKSLTRQMFDTGWWIPATILTDRSNPFSVRHFVPGASLMIGFASMLLLAALPDVGRLIMLALIGGYLSMAAIYAARGADRNVARYLATIAVFPIVHVSYGLGTIIGIVHSLLAAMRKSQVQ